MQVTIQDGEVRTIEGQIELTLDEAVKKHVSGNAEQTFLQTVNNLLATHRMKARDHGAKEHDGKEDMFCGAALIKSKAGNYYVSANIHLHNTPTSRNCAEAMSITDGVNVEGDNFEVDEVWFMGGHANVYSNIPILPGEAGQRIPPCGSCRDVIFNRKPKDGSDVTIHMLPLNDGKWIIEPDDGKETLNVAQIKTRTLRDLLPQLTQFLHDEAGALKNDVLAGYDYLLNAEQLEESISDACLSGAVERLNEMEKNGAKTEAIAKEINNIMMDTLRDEFHREGEPRLTKGTITIVRTCDGEYFLGSYFEDGHHRSSPSAVQNALQNARRERVTDVFTLPVDFTTIEKTREKYTEDKTADVELTMPDGTMRDQINKGRPKGRDYAKGETKNLHGETMKQGDSPQLHVFLPNDPKAFKYETHSFSVNVSDLLGKGEQFESPKMRQ